jgi:acetyl-CoA C-acetyltransferase
MNDAVIVSAARTPVGSFGGQFKDVPATELGAHAISAALEMRRSNVHRGVATLCVGGGQGQAAIIRNGRHAG